VRASRGFTLIEVLVALAIVAIGMAAVLESLTSSANTTMYLQDKTFAGWVALNRIETVRLSGTIPQAGTSNDNISFAGQSWEWQQKVTTTQIPGMVEIEVDVKPADSTAGDDKGWYATATGFMGSAIAPSTNPPPPAWSSNPIDTLPTSIPGQSGTTTTPTVSAPTQ
jgi:general secretion pathway protein I